MRTKVLAVLTLVLLGVMVACAPAQTPAPTPLAVEEEAPAPTPPVENYVLGYAAYRTGAFGRTGTPFANGTVDMEQLVNLKGGVGGVPIDVMDIETGYETPRGVEAYERAKATGRMLAFIPLSTGTTYAVTPKAFEDNVVVLHTAYGISAAADGDIFPHNFLAAPTYWSGETVIMKWIQEQEGGSLEGKKIGILYLDIDYGRETLPIHEVLAPEMGYELIKYPIPWPGLEQSAVWTTIAERDKPDWIIWRLWGDSTPTALREADRVGYPMERIVGTYWSPVAVDALAFNPEKSKGVRRIEFVTPGTDFPLIQEILRELYDKGKGAGARDQVGMELYNRGVYNVGLLVAAIQLAYEEFGHPLDGEKLAWGLERITAETLKKYGMGVADFAPEVTLTGQDHEGGGFVQVVEWDGIAFKPISDWLTPLREEVDPLVREAAQKFKEENPELYK
ncbi:MAG: ABC transporter substrate-binding protein [Anaerolineae bacterium]